jgi:hypothetical protein
MNRNLTRLLRNCIDNSFKYIFPRVQFNLLARVYSTLATCGSLQARFAAAAHPLGIVSIEPQTKSVFYPDSLWETAVRDPY